MTPKTSGIWCVGLCLTNGTHVFHVFDDEAQARRFKKSVITTKQAQGVAVKEVHIWEL